MLQFRIYPIAITADIEKAYFQINVDEKDKDYLRFLWFKNLFTDQETQICKYRFTRVIFGATCSQFLRKQPLIVMLRSMLIVILRSMLIAILRSMLIVTLILYVNTDPGFVKKVQGKFYVDDLNTGVYSVKEGIELCKKLKIRFQEVQFNLRKWRTNSKELRKFIEPFDVNIEIVKNGAVNMGIVNSQTVNSEFVNKMKNGKVLGIEWDDDNDKLIFRLNEILKDALKIQPTKRNILSVISTIYDPVGYLQLVTIQLKILFQEICKLKVDWNDIIEEI